MWIKKEFNIHNEEAFLKLAEKHSCYGFVIYDYFLCFLGQQELSEIDSTSLKFKKLKNDLGFTYNLEQNIIDDVLKTLIELKILGLKNNIIYSSELKNCFNHMEDIKQKRKIAGKKSAEIRAIKKETIKLNKQEFNIMEVEGFQGDFSHVKNKEELKLDKPVLPKFSNFTDEFLEEQKNIFIEITTECFNKNTEPFAQKNKMEKEASTRLIELVSTGLLHLPTLSDKSYSFEQELKNDCLRISNKKNSDSRFFLTNLLNFYLSESNRIKINRVDEYKRLYSEVLDHLNLELLE